MNDPRWYEIPFVIVRKRILEFLFRVACYSANMKRGNHSIYGWEIRLMHWCLVNEPYPDWPTPETK